MDKDFEILKLRYEDQVALTRYMSMLELKVLFGYFASIAALVAWLTTKTNEKLSSVGYLAAIVVVVTVCVVLYFCQMKCRRNEAVQTIKNLNEALGLNENGRFIRNKTINAKAPQNFVYHSTFWVYNSCVILTGMTSICFIFSL